MSITHFSEDMKKQSHTAETVPKFNRKIVERRKSDISSIQKNDRSLSGFGTSNLIKKWRDLTNCIDPNLLSNNTEYIPSHCSLFNQYLCGCLYDQYDIWSMAVVYYEFDH